MQNLEQIYYKLNFTNFTPFNAEFRKESTDKNPAVAMPTKIRWVALPCYGPTKRSRQRRPRRRR